MILNHLCYASGNSEPGPANPTKSTAIKRVDNYGAGFLRAGAKAVFAEAISSVAYTIRSLFRSTRSMNSIFTNHPAASGARDFYFTFGPNGLGACPPRPAPDRQVLAIARRQLLSDLHAVARRRLTRPGTRSFEARRRAGPRHVRLISCQIVTP